MAAVGYFYIIGLLSVMIDSDGLMPYSVVRYFILYTEISDDASFLLHLSYRFLVATCKLQLNSVVISPFSAKS